MTKTFAIGVDGSIPASDQWACPPVRESRIPDTPATLKQPKFSAAEVTRLADTSGNGHGHRQLTPVSIPSIPDLVIPDEFTGETKRRARHPRQRTSQVSSSLGAGAFQPAPIETNFRALKDGSLVDLVEDPDDQRQPCSLFGRMAPSLSSTVGARRPMLHTNSTRSGNLEAHSPPLRGGALHQHSNSRR